jgi:L-ascorbate metabolism protein UlaG (beta-lactamase superfamily)
MAAIGEKEKLDVAFCTVGIAPGATPETGFEIARLTKPQVAVPYHTNSPTEQKRFAEILKAQLPRTACLIPELNKIYQVTKRK